MDTIDPDDAHDRLLATLPPRPRRSQDHGWSSRLRRAWDRHGGVASTVALGCGAAIALWIDGPRWAATLPVAWMAWRLRAEQADTRSANLSLEAEADWLASEREQVAARLDKERSRVLGSLVVALAFAAFAQVSRTPEVAYLVGVAALVLGILRHALLAPGLERELRDLGGESRTGWKGAIVIAAVMLCFVVASPFVLLFHGGRALVRKLRGGADAKDDGR